MRNDIPSNIFDAKTLFNSIGEAMHNGPKSSNADNYVSMKTKVERQLQAYDDAVEQRPNTLHLLSPLWPSDCPESKTARSMYKSNGDEIQQIRNDLMQRNGNGDPYLCPICECEPIYHLDHYIPRDKMPEFSVHPQNLIYLCKHCNEKKRILWLDENNNRIVFNAYYDTPSGFDLLICEVNSIENDLPKAKIKWNTQVNHNSDSLREKTTLEKLEIDKLYERKVNELLDTLVKLALAETRRRKACGHHIEDIWATMVNDYNDVLKQPNNTIIQRYTYQGLANSTVMLSWLDDHS